jgi:RHS repeat-associated protein
MWRLTRSLTAGSVLALPTAPAAAYHRVVYSYTDIAGSPVATPYPAGAFIWPASYAPYGKRLDGQVGADNQIWFTGKREETLLDLHYYGARWYDARLGRFLSPDPVGVREADIHSFNRYAYANNNPYIYTDPDGRVPLLVLVPPALSLMGKALSVAGAALTGWAAGSNVYDVYTGEKTPGAAAQDAAIDMAIAATLKGAGAGLVRGVDSLRAATKGNRDQSRTKPLILFRGTQTKIVLRCVLLANKRKWI